MASYSETRDYFKLLAEKHKEVKHIEGSEKKFYESTMEEVLFGVQNGLPGPEKGPFVIFVGYMDRLKAQPQAIVKREIMFFIMQSAGKDDPKRETAAAEITEIVYADFIRRFKYDSENEEGIWDHSFDAVADVDKSPHDFIASGAKFRGWQVIVSVMVPFNDCYDENSWEE